MLCDQYPENEGAVALPPLHCFARHSGASAGGEWNCSTTPFKRKGPTAIPCTTWKNSAMVLQPLQSLDWWRPPAGI